MKRLFMFLAVAASTLLLGAETPPIENTGLALDDYLGSPGLTWSTGGNAAWYGQTAVSRTGMAVQSGDIEDGQTSWLETTVQGPCDFSFWWNVSSEETFDLLVFSVDSVAQESISGYDSSRPPAQDIGWVQRTLTLPAGSHTLRWTYIKDESASLASDCGWLADVTYVQYVTVTFNAQGGAASTNQKVVQVFVPYGVLPTVTKTGYNLAYWETGDGQQVEPELVVSIPTNHTLYAHWTPNEYTLTFDAQSGEVIPSATTVTYGEPYGDLPVPTRPGYLFDGWSTQAGGGSQITSEILVSTASNHTLYAKWSVQLFTVTFDGQGATPSPLSTTVTNTMTYGVLATVSKTGYGFNGWFTAPSGSGLQILPATGVSLTANQTLYASWTPNTYTVFFNGQGGTVTPTNKVVSYQLPYGTLSLSVLSDAVMDSWWTQPNGKGQKITSATNVVLLADHTLYAKWDINSILGTSNLAWTTDGSGGSFWRPQAAVKPAGRNLAMQSGTLTHSQSTWIETTVTGPGTFSFSWAIAAEVNQDMMTCTTNGVPYKTLTSKTVNWTNETISVGAGTCTIRWAFSKSQDWTVATDAAWLGAVTWTSQVGGFSAWASNLGLVGAPAVVFTQDRNGDRIPNGLEYAFGSHLSPGEQMLTIRLANGHIVLEVPKQDPATVPFVTLTVKACTDLGTWTLPAVPASDTTGKPSNRDWFEAQGTPAKAFFKLQAELN